MEKSRASDHRREISRTSYRRLKQVVMEAYGGTCDCCGEQRIEFLTIDHITPVAPKGLGRRKTTGAYLYRSLKKLGFPPGFRPLCFNCNCSYGHFGYCPHREVKEWVRPAQRIHLLGRKENV